ncbi:MULTISPECIES: SusC/RagA family TonB-linked outer membrane protein [Algoriphagus]|uniref:SusC/RagA family TonB-linked outer membrane protein n=1 Tax=Algoriphagus TaxID=246875 RepID=UPI0011A66AFD|nr:MULTISPECIES: SusC/RagA family TonB-linked outer membrane protein [Algoriphagus]
MKKNLLPHAIGAWTGTGHIPNAGLPEVPGKYEQHTSLQRIMQSLIWLILRFMRWSTVILGIICCSAATLMAIPSNGQSPLDKKVTLSLAKAPLATALKELETSSGIPLVYGGEVYSGNYVLSISARDWPVRKVLDHFFKELPFNYKESDGEILVTYSPQQKIPLAKPIPEAPDINDFQTEVSGTVTDSLGQALIGVTVQVKGSSSGTVTDADGYFILREIPDNSILVFRMVGYQTQEVEVGNSTQLKITLKESISQLQGVTVSTGYETIPLERATGSFSIVDQELFNRRVSPDVLSRIEGVTNGVLFNRSSTGAPSISIRGNSTIYGNASPLIILDGFPFDGRLEDINPNDIDQVTVLKDAAAASLWGTRSGNGVIVINTRKGKLHQPLRIEINSNVTVGARPDLNYKPMVSSSAFIEMERELFQSSFYRGEETNTFTRPPLSPVVELLIAQRDGLISESEVNTQLSQFQEIDVREEFDRYFQRNSLSQQYAFNASGGSAAVRYYFSAGYDRNLSNLVGNHSERLTLSSQNTFSLFKGLSLQTGLMYIQNKGAINNPGYGMLNSSTGTKGLYPYARLADNDGQALPVAWGYRTPFTEEAESAGLLDWSYYPLGDLQQSNNRQKADYIRVNTGLNYQILPGLKIMASYQMESSVDRNTDLRNQQMYETRNLINRFTQTNEDGTLSRPVPEGEILSTFTNTLMGHTSRVQLDFYKNINQRHEITALGGFEVKETQRNGDTFTLYGYNPSRLTSQAVNHNTLYKLYNSTIFTDNIPSLRTITDLTDRFRSYYSNASYTYLGKYTFSASARMDESNLFGVAANQRRVPLWSSGFKWLITGEPFLNSDVIDQLVLRSTYGINGNIDKSVTAYTTANSSIDFSTLLPTSDIINPPNPDLKWERIAIFNIGTDFSIFNGRISGSLEWYQKKGSDLLGFIEADPTTGVLRYKGNVASIKGNGWDVQVQTVNINKSVQWNTRLLFSYVKDEVTDINLGSILRGNTITQQQAAFAGSPINIIPVQGRPVYGMYSYQFAGLDAENGNPLGYLDGMITDNYSALRSTTDLSNLIFHGSARPTYFGSIMNDVSWKQFSLSMNVIYKLGYFFRKGTVDFTAISRNWNGHVDFERRWLQPGDETTTNIPSLPMLANTARNDFYQYTDITVLNASHARLQDIRISYRFPSGLTAGTGQMPVELYLYMNNVGIIWRANREKIDPDYVPVNNATALPLPRTIAAGFRIAF